LVGPAVRLACPQTCAASSNAGATLPAMDEVKKENEAICSVAPPPAPAAVSTCTKCSNYFMKRGGLNYDMRRTSIDSWAENPACESKPRGENAVGCEEEPDKLSSAWQVKDCSAMLVIARLRPNCELNHPDWKRLSNNAPAPTMEDRMDWVMELIEEYSDNYKKQDKPTTKPHFNGQDNVWNKLEEHDIKVTMFHNEFLAIEIMEVISAEILGLGLTFLLMYFFLIAAIGPLMWRRWILSILVLVQPLLAMLMAVGLGEIPVWVMAPGDFDEDGVEDNVLALTMLTILGLHLMLAIIVDYDIILMRAFDRITKKLRFEDRIPVAVGYAHRTISVSMLVGALAFAFGSIVDLPVLVYFCWHSCLALFGLYIGMFTMFLGFMVLLEGSDPANKQVIDGNPIAAEAPLRELVVKSSSDEFFASILAHPVSVIVFIIFEVVLLGLYFVAGEVKSKFEGSEYMLPDAKIRDFVDNVNGMGGFPDQVTIWMPNSDIGQYHKKERRDYYMTVIDTLRRHEPAQANPTGIPSIYSWMHEFKAFSVGSAGNSTNPTMGELKDPHNGCTTCPRVWQPKHHNWGILFPTGKPEMVDTILSNVEMESEGGITNFIIRGLQKGNMKITKPSSKHGNTKMGIENPTEKDIRTKFPYMSEPGNGYVVNLVTVWDETQCMPHLKSANPKNTNELMSQFTSVQQFKDYLKAQLIAVNGTGSNAQGIELSLRLRSHARWFMDLDYVERMGACNDPTRTNDYNEKAAGSFVDHRIAFWGTDVGAPYFYDMLHDWYEGWDTYTCCEHRFIPGTFLEKNATLRNRAAIDLWTKTESSSGRLAWRSVGKRVTGLSASIAQFYIKYDLKDSEKRIVLMHELIDMFNAIREAHPDRWGSEFHIGEDEKGEKDESFISAQFFLNSDRDEMMPVYLEHHLLNVYMATIAGCVVFMHPFYGLLTGAFLVTTMLQIQGIMAFMDIDLDIVSFAVIVMAMGFAIEYVVHIAHAFLHCAGSGLERTKNAQEEMGLTVFSAFLSTAVQQVVLLVMGQSKVFQIYPLMMLIVIIKAGLSGFLLVPSVLGLVDTILSLCPCLRRAKPAEQKLTAVGLAA